MYWCWVWLWPPHSAGCRESPPQITGLRVFTTWPSGLQPVQLAFVFSADNESVGTRQVRPEMPKGPLTNGIDLVVYLPDRYAGRTVRIDVDALGPGRAASSPAPAAR